MLSKSRSVITENQLTKLTIFNWVSNHLAAICPNKLDTLTHARVHLVYSLLNCSSLSVEPLCVMACLQMLRHLHINKPTIKRQGS